MLASCISRSAWPLFPHFLPRHDLLEFCLLNNLSSIQQAKWVNLNTIYKRHRDLLCKVKNPTGGVQTLGKLKVTNLDWLINLSRLSLGNWWDEPSPQNETEKCPEMCQLLHLRISSELMLWWSNASSQMWMVDLWGWLKLQTFNPLIWKWSSL